MIKFNLICKNCKHCFDSWFPSSKEFELLKKKKLINCYNCNSIDINKSIMAPNLSNTKKKRYLTISRYKKNQKTINKKSRVY